jgi:FtsH-binding integral membrane protein
MIGWFNYPPLAFLASIFTIICLCGLDLNAQTQIKCFSFISATAFFTGIYLSPLIALAVVLDPQLVVTAFLMTTIIFLCLTLSVLLTPKLTYLYLGGKKKKEISRFENKIYA